MHMAARAYAKEMLIMIIITVNETVCSTLRQRVAVRAYEKSRGRVDFVKSTLCGLYFHFKNILWHWYDRCVLPDDLSLYLEW